MTIGTHIKNFGLFVDGNSYIGEAKEVNLPKVIKVMEEYQAGGMIAPVEIERGLEKMETDFQLAGTKLEILELMGTTELGSVVLTLRAGVSDETGAIVPHVHTVRGTLKGFESGTIKVQEGGSIKVMMAVTYYKHEIDGANALEVDAMGMVFKTGDNDVWADLRAAIGL